VSCNDWKSFHEKSKNILSWLTAPSWINKAAFYLHLTPYNSNPHWLGPRTDSHKNWFLISSGFPSNITAILSSVNLMNLLKTQSKYFSTICYWEISTFTMKNLTNTVNTVVFQMNELSYHESRTKCSQLIITQTQLLKLLITQKTSIFQFPLKCT